MDSLSVLLIIIAVLLLALIIWFAVTLRAFARLNRTLDESWKQVEVELSRRHDLIDDVLVALTAAGLDAPTQVDSTRQARDRAATMKAGPAGKAELENAVSAALEHLFDAADAQGEPGADRTVRRLAGELTNIEDRIAAGRRYYNANVRANNGRCTSFPGTALAAVGLCAPAELFASADPAVRAAPSATFAQDRDHGEAAP
ncbi:MAG: LemA family protein [Bowdeniella nasicola]|nr:LemA family protein [Bowdeniella nasicola]